jgi:hypothetical protein
MKLHGYPITLNAYESPKVITNKYFASYRVPDLERIYFPNSMKPFSDSDPLVTKEFLVDDNRSAVVPKPSATIDNMDFYQNVKGIGSSTDPFSRRPFREAEICSFVKNDNIASRIRRSREAVPRYLTGELWSRGSPYGAQGLQYADIAMKAAEMATSPTSIHGFRIAPIVKIVFLPEDVERQISKIYWYRRFKLPMVQEERLVPSNVRIYFHSDHTLGDDTSWVFDLFEIDTSEKAVRFEINFLKSGMAVLTLFSRSIKNNYNGTHSGLDFYDVWLDKDAVLAPDGTIYWADLEGLEWITVWDKDPANPDAKSPIEEKMEYQIYRCMYEFMYAYEQIEIERCKRFGVSTDRKTQFEYLLKEALREDEVIELVREPDCLDLNIGNILREEELTKKFTIIDW